MEKTGIADVNKSSTTLSRDIFQCRLMQTGLHVIEKRLMRKVIAELN